MCKRNEAAALSPAIRACLAGGRGGPAAKSATALGLFLSCAAAAHADVFTVTSAGDPGVSGLSLRQAIGNANGTPNSVVLFDPSLNGSTITLAQGEISVLQGMVIAGPGADKLTISGGGASRLFNIKTNEPTTPVTISGLTLTGGANANGGMLYMKDSSLLLQASDISGNSGSPYGVLRSVTDGAGYYARLQDLSIHGNSTSTSSWMIGFRALTGSMMPTILRCTIANNTGGGIYTRGNTSLSVSYSRISSASANFGGAIAAYQAKSVVVSDSTITGNSAVFDGGAFWLYDTPAAIHRSVVSGNSAAGNGGAVMVTGSAALLVPAGTLVVDTSTISGNNAYDYGGGIDVKRASGVYVHYSLVSNNGLTDFTTGANGGGLALQFVVGPTQIYNSTFYQNFAYHSAGGIGIFDLGTGNNAKFINVTIANNHTFNGYSNGLLGAGQPTITNSIIANNSNQYVQTQDVVGSFKVNYSLIKNASAATISGSHNITNGTDPQLGPLTVNGGPTLTMLPLAASPVVNAGTATSAGFLTDQRRVARLVGSHVDMGAVERQNPEVIIFRNGFDSS